MVYSSTTTNDPNVSLCETLCGENRHPALCPTPCAMLSSAVLTASLLAGLLAGAQTPCVMATRTTGRAHGGATSLTRAARMPHGRGQGRARPAWPSQKCRVVQCHFLPPFLHARAPMRRAKSLCGQSAQNLVNKVSSEQIFVHRDPLPRTNSGHGVERTTAIAPQGTFNYDATQSSLRIDYLEASSVVTPANMTIFTISQTAQFIRILRDTGRSQRPCALHCTWRWVGQPTWAADAEFVGREVLGIEFYGRSALWTIG